MGYKRYVWNEKRRLRAWISCRFGKILSVRRWNEEPFYILNAYNLDDAPNDNKVRC